MRYYHGWRVSAYGAVRMAGDEKKERKENASHLLSILYPGIIKKKTKKILSLFEVDGSHAQDGAAGLV